MLDATFDDPDLTTFTGLHHLGLRITEQRLEPGRAVPACLPVQDPDSAEADRWCRRCGCQGRPRGTVLRRLTHVPFGHRPTTLQLTLVRLVCTGCGRVWRQDTTAAAEPRAKLTRTALTWALRAIVVQHLTVARVAEALAVSWHRQRRGPGRRPASPHQRSRALRRRRRHRGGRACVAPHPQRRQVRHRLID